MNEAEVRAGQAVYTPLVLRLYDLVVLDLSCQLVWRCPKGRMLELYDRSVAAEHLDIGVGTGFYLDHCRFPVARPRITLVDLNPHALAHTARRLARYDVTTHQTNALEPLGLPPASFGSAALTFLLHCLPGDLPAKAAVLDHAAEAVRPGGVVFGATILSSGVEVNPAARVLMAGYNARGIFHNRHDSREALEDALAARFPRYDLEVHGCVALFRAQVG